VSWIDFERPVEFVHHSTEPEDRGEGLSIDTEQLTQIAEQRKVGISTSLIRSNCPFAEGLPLLKVSKACCPICGQPPLITFIKGLFGEWSILGHGRHRRNRYSGSDENDYNKDLHLHGS
jgi:hypothetical protein